MARSPATASSSRTPTLDGFVRQPASTTKSLTKKRASSSGVAADDTTPKKLKPSVKGKAGEATTAVSARKPGSSTPKVKTGTKTSSPATTKRKKSSQPVKKKRKAFVADNRKLGTVELLDSSDESDASTQSPDLTVLSPPPVAGTSGVKRKAGKIVLEEEDWLKQDEAPAERDGGRSQAPLGVTPAATENTIDDGPEGTANLAAAEETLRDPREQDPHDGCTDNEDADELVVQEAATDDEVIIVPGPSKPAAKASTTGSFLAPLSRLFTRAPPERGDSPTGPASSDEDRKGSKQPFSMFSSLPNAFTALMAGNAETVQWKAAEKADKQKGRLPKGEERRVPFYKWIDGMEITVDAFRYGKIDGCKAYFLSHAHSDHYQNLSSTWSGGPIYASQTTINLIKLKLGVRDEYLFPLPLDETVKVHGIDVTLIDANHCPGSVLFLFEGPHTDPKSPYSKTPNRIFRYLHCGDFRASPQHIVHPCMSFPSPPSSKPATLQTQLRAPSMSRSSSAASSSSTAGIDSIGPGWTDPLPGRTQKRLDAIYLDTTYLGPSYCFPAQELVISACAQLVRERIIEGDEAALWRADGRDAERKGMKGWLAQREGVKGEVKDEDESMMELEALPEEYDEDDVAMAMREETPLKGQRSVSSTPRPHVCAADDEPDEEAWLAAHDERVEAESYGLPGPAAIMAAVNDTAQHGMVTTVPLSSNEDAQQKAPRELPGAPPAFPAADPMEASASTRPNELHQPALASTGQSDIPPSAKVTDTAPFHHATVDPKGDGLPVDVKPKEEELPQDVKPAVEGLRGGDVAHSSVKEEDEKPELKPKKERLLVLIGTYSIGKERIVKAIAHALSTKVYCDGYKRSLFLAQDDPGLHALLTEDPLEAQVHIGGLRDITREVMQDYLGKYKAPRVENGFTSMIGLRPTGWTYRSESKDKFPSIAKILQIEQARKFSPAGLYPQRDSTPLTMAFGVPYSEHSSFFELTCFCLSLEYTRIIPTVNVHTANSRNKMKQWIDRWAAEKKRRKDAKLPRIVPYRNGNYW